MNIGMSSQWGRAETNLAQRIPEPELMDAPEQIRAYDEADFSTPHEAFVDQFWARFYASPRGRMVDLGCGSGDLTRRWADRSPDLAIDAVDGSPNMILYAKSASYSYRSIRWLCERLPIRRELATLLAGYDVVVSNSLLHHLPNPAILWEEVRRLSRPGTHVLVGDLVRPRSIAEASKLVELHAAGAKQILKRDFFHSLCAAYRVEEVAVQLREHSLDWLQIERTSDRHLLVWGRRP